VSIIGIENMPRRIVDLLSLVVIRPGFSVPAYEASALQKWWRTLWYRPPLS
jgi:hypothetical protein